MFMFSRFWAGFQPKLGPGTCPTAPAWKTLPKSTKIKPGDGFQGTEKTKIQNQREDLGPESLGSGIRRGNMDLAGPETRPQLG